MNNIFYNGPSEADKMSDFISYKDNQLSLGDEYTKMLHGPDYSLFTTNQSLAWCPSSDYMKYASSPLNSIVNGSWDSSSLVYGINGAAEIGTRYSPVDLVNYPRYSPFNLVNYQKVSTLNIIDSAIDSSLFLINQELENKYTLGIKSLEKNVLFDSESFNHSVSIIKENTVYNKQTLFNDLKGIDEYSYLIQRAPSYIKFESEVDIDQFFNEHRYYSPIDLYVLYGDLGFATELYQFIRDRGQIVKHLTLKALNRFVEAEKRRIKKKGRIRFLNDIPILLHLREYLDNINNIKDKGIEFWFSPLFNTNIIILNINTNDNTTINRFNMLPYPCQS